MKKILYLAVFAVLAAGCNDFLDVKPEHNMTQDNAVTDYESAVKIITGMYASLNYGSGTSTADFFGGAPFLALSGQAGVAKGGSSFFFSMTYAPSTVVMETFWKNWHACVNAANAAIIGIEGLDDKYFSGQPKSKARMLGEARCFRGWVNWHLLCCFGHFWEDNQYGILCREEISNLANVYADRKSVAESYAHIFGDLDEAIKTLPDYATPRYMSKQLAQVMKAKLLLNRGASGDYAAALAIVDEVIATAPAIFKMDPDMKNMYKEAWDSNEVLWARYTEDNSYRAYGEGSYSLQLIQSGYLAANASNPVIPEGTDESKNSFHPEFAGWIKNDPRYAVTMGWARAISATGSLFHCPTKLARNGRVIMNDKWTTYYFRYPELYLMQAELRARTGATIAQALEPINLMRSKRTNPALPALAVPATMDELMEIIFKEYCLELYGENGSEWFASVRITKNGVPFYRFMKPDLAATVTENQQAWPIPSTETNVNKSMTPNPGYDAQ